MNHDIEHCDGVIKTANGNVFCDRRWFCERNRAHQEAKEFGLTVPYSEAKICVSNGHYNFVHRLDSDKLSTEEFWEDLHSLRTKGEISYLYLLDKVREHAFVLEAEALQSKMKILKLEEDLMVAQAKLLKYESGQILPKFKIGDTFSVHFDYYKPGETTSHVISRIDLSGEESDGIVYWSDDDDVWISEWQLLEDIAEKS